MILCGREQVGPQAGGIDMRVEYAPPQRFLTGFKMCPTGKKGLLPLVDGLRNQSSHGIVAPNSCGDTQGVADRAQALDVDTDRALTGDCQHSHPVGM